MKGRAELQSGAVLLIVGALGLVLVKVWGASSTPSGSGIVFTGFGFASGVLTIMLGGVLAIGVGLLVLGVTLWLIARIRDAKLKDS